MLKIGVIGAGFGATFSEEGGDNTGLYASAVTGFMLGAFQKRIQSKQFELIPTNIKQAAVDELEIEYRRSNYNVLKSFTNNMVDILDFKCIPKEFSLNIN